MASKKYPWEEWKIEFFQNPNESLVDFIRRKTDGKGVYVDRFGKTRIKGPFLGKTNGWVKERKEYWTRVLADPEYFREKFMTEEKKKAWAEALDKAIEFYPKMMLAYMKRIIKKVDEGKGPYIDELIKFGKLIQEYSGVKLLDEGEQNINIINNNISFEEYKKASEELKNLETQFEDLNEETKK